LTAKGIHEEEIYGKAYDARLARRLLGYLKPYRWQVVLSVGVLVSVAGLEVIGPLLTRAAIDRAIPAGDAELLWLLVAIYAGTLVLAFLLDYVQTLLTTWLGQRIMYDLRVEVFAHLQSLPLRFFDRNPVGRLMTRVTNDVEVLNELFSSGVVTVFGDLFTLLFIVTAMLRLDLGLSLVTFAVLPLVFLAAFVFRGLVRRAYRDIRIRVARINAFLQERITGMRVIQLFGREEEASRRYEKVNRDHLEAQLRSITYYALFLPVIEVFTAVALALILWHGAGRMVDGSLTVGTVTAFLLWAQRFFRPIQDLSEKYNLLQGAMASSERIFGLLDTPSEVSIPANPRQLPARREAVGAVESEPREATDGVYRDPGDLASVSGSEPGPLGSGGGETDCRAAGGAIEFRDVWFSYGPRGPEATEEEWVLKGVSFRVEPGQRVAIVGATGAGKSTIINLLMRFYDAQRGEILYDGVPIDRVPLAELRDRVGLVLQDVFLFSEDVDFNIRMGRTEVNDRRVREAARRVRLDPFVARLPRGYEQPLGERGASLSVGERQLVSFARALAVDPELLILDEATSSVDTELEAYIEDALAELMRGRTSLVIAHRLSTVIGADQILVLHHGEVRERGTHAELLRKDGLYRRLYELQFVGHGEAA
jgi:ATP-binding cassette subfamily B multidrug efflux pump